MNIISLVYIVSMYHSNQYRNPVLDLTFCKTYREIGFDDFFGIEKKIGCLLGVLQQPKNHPYLNVRNIENQKPGRLHVTFDKFRGPIQNC